MSARGRISTSPLAAAAAAVCAALASAPVPAADRSEQLVVTVGASELPGISGSRVAIDWIRRSAENSLHAGIERRRVGASDWKLVELGGLWYGGSRLDFGASLELGPGAAFAATDSYRRLQAGIGFRPAPRWRIAFDEIRIRVAPIEGNLLGASTSRTWGSAFTTNLKLSTSHSGNLDEQSVALQLNYSARVPHFVAGFVAGSSNNRLLLDIPSDPATATRLRQGFIGLSAPIGRTTTSVFLEASKVGELRRIGLTLSVAIGLDAKN